MIIQLVINLITIVLLGLTFRNLRKARASQKKTQENLKEIQENLGIIGIIEKQSN